MLLIDKGENGMKQYIAYVGAEFTIEWYYDVKGQSQALEYFSKQPKCSISKFLTFFD